jgi:hypothetical protein
MLRSLLGDDSLAINDHLNKIGVDKGRRYIHPRNVVVEMAVYTDSKYTERFLPRDTAKRIELMMLKYNGVNICNSHWSLLKDEIYR